MTGDDLHAAFAAVLRRNRKPWREWSELERRRERRAIEDGFIEGGYSPQDARELAIAAEGYADELDPPAS